MLVIVGEELISIVCRMYQDKLATLKDQLVQLDTDVHPEYLKRVKKIEQAYNDRILLNEAFLSYEVSLCILLFACN